MDWRQKVIRYPVLLMAILLLMAAIWAGLLRLGWRWPLLTPILPGLHGPLMVSGFFGTLISLERVVALQKRWLYLGPVLSGLGGILWLLGIPAVVGQAMFVAGSVMLCVIFGIILRRHMGLDTLTMGAGALAWLLGNLLWLSGLAIYRVVPWWMGFFVLTIAGERLELGRVLGLSRVRRFAFGGTAGVLVSGLFLSLASYKWGITLTSLGLIALGLWLMRYDIARHTARQKGLTRFMALCMLSGYVWMVVGGIAGVIMGAAPGGVGYEILLHAVFLGFVFAMVFGHAPVIFPAVLGVQVPYHPSLYLPLGLLHVSLALRLSGALAIVPWARQWGGMINGLAILLFFGLFAAQRVAGRSKLAT